MLHANKNRQNLLVMGQDKVLLNQVDFNERGGGNTCAVSQSRGGGGHNGGGLEFYGLVMIRGWGGGGGYKSIKSIKGSLARNATNAREMVYSVIITL